GRCGGGGGAWRSSGRNGTIFGSGFAGPGGAAGGAAAAGRIGSAGAGGGDIGAIFGASGVISAAGLSGSGGSGAISLGTAGLGFTMVAAGRTSTVSSAPSPFFFARDGLAVPSAAMPSVFGFATRLGLAASS